MKNYTPSKEEFENQIKTYIQNVDSLALINKAYEFAQEKHKGQLRMSGEPYFNHLLCVGYEVSKLHAGPNTIAAALLHDCIEDCGVTKEEFINEFNEEIYTLVEAVTKIGNLEFVDEKEYLAENHRKIFLAMAKDIRVIIIKLVDRLHNMRTLEFQPKEKQLSISKETLEVYAPIAHRLGIAEIKNELEDLCFYYLDNKKYHEIASLVESKKTERDDYIKKMIDDISNNLNGHNIKYEIFGRSKHLYSIYNKMQRKNKRFEEILDLLAIRIITESELNCYEALGYIHATYHPIPGRLKDYIAMPKFNMYRSLHTTVVGIDGKIFEIQIRTKEMDQIAEKGIAAHWAYKEGAYNKHEEQQQIIKELKWLKTFEEEESTSNANDYMDTVGDLFNSNVYVMTPKGRIIDLPSGSTPIDFAYRIHTDIGHHTVGSIVNGALVPLNTPLKTGDVVELKINKNSSPSEDWIKIVKTRNARNKINSFFQKKELEEKSEIIKLGETLLRDEMKKDGLDLDKYFKKEKFEKMFHIVQVKNMNEFYYSIGCKSLTPQTVIQNLVKLGKKEINETEINQMLSKSKKNKVQFSNTGIMVDGLSSMKIILSPCCTPVYGDDIIGYVTKGQGIKAHRRECQNISSEQKRIIDLKWDSNKTNIKYDACIRIHSNDRSYLLTDLVACISQFKTTMVSVNISVNNDNLTATALIVLKVEDKDELENIMANLRKVESVISVERSFK